MARPQLFGALLLLVITSACVDPAGPEELRFGRYTLRRMNGDALPGVLVENSIARLEFLSGALWLHRDGTFTDSTHAKLTALTSGTVKMVNDVAAGTFRMSRDTLYLNSTRGEHYHMIFQAAGSLTQELSGSTLVYRK